MERLSLVDSNNQNAALYGQIEKALGAIPNVFRMAANSTPVLGAVWAGFGAAASGRLPAVLVEKISVAVSNANRCEYCAAARTFLGLKAGATADEMAAAQTGQGNNAKETAALRFALVLLRDRGHVSDGEVAEVHEHYSAEEILEIVHVESLTTFTNTINNSMNTPVDFPLVTLIEV